MGGTSRQTPPSRLAPRAAPVDNRGAAAAPAIATLAVLVLLGGCKGPAKPVVTPAAPSTALSLSPAEISIAYSGSEQRISLRASVGGLDRSAQVAFTAAAPDLVQLEGSTVVIRAGLRYGALTEISARLGSQVVRIPVTIKRVGPALAADASVPKDAAEYFKGSASAPPPVWFYPLPGALLARNMNQIEFQFRGDPAYRLYRLTLDGQTYAQDFYLSAASCKGDRCRFAPTDEQWAIMTRSATGDQLRLVLTGSTGPGRALGTSEPLSVRFSPEDVRGGLYYWSTTIQGIYRVSLESRQAAVFMDPKRNTTCVGCHVISQDSTKVAAVFGGPDGIGGVVDGVDGGRYLVRPTNVRWNFQTFSPRGDLLLVNYQQGLRVLDANNLKLVRQITREELGGAAAQPEWSPDGKAIVFARYPADGSGKEVMARNVGDIAVLPWSDGAPGPVQVIVPSRKGEEYHFYPSWTPDSRWIIFNTGKVPCGSSQGGPCNSYDARNTRLRLVRATAGSAPLELRAATRGEGLSTNWPRVAPFTQAGGKLIFFTFSSRGSYGFAERKEPQIWMAAVDLQRAEQQPGQDPSYPPFWLPFQKAAENNHLATWTNRVLCSAPTECPPNFDCVAHQCVPLQPVPDVAPTAPTAPVDKDSDGDGILDKEDRCPTEAGPKENQGCPDSDKDGDGVVDRLDKCPAEPGPKEREGCPEPDTDKDTLPDSADQCPREAGPKENQGCPARRFVTMRTDRLELKGKIIFATNKSKIRPDSYELMDDVVGIMKENPLLRLRIEGHTDNKGKAEKNLRLSDARARAVRSYLIGKGVDGARLRAEGFGMTRPIADNKTAVGREKNRRTDFFIDR